ALGAVAYTQGSDLHFAPGTYQPETAGGQQLLGHELAHVVQQRAGGVATVQHKGAPTVDEDASLEAEADRAGAAAALGARVQVHGAAHGGVQRAINATHQFANGALSIDMKAMDEQGKFG